MPQSPTGGWVNASEVKPWTPDSGLLSAGNIDLTNRPRVKNPDGSISTVRSISIDMDGKEVLIPTVSEDGRILSTPDAIAQFRRTGKHLGIFDSPASATAYAQQLHTDQAAQLDRGGWVDASAVKPAAAPAEDTGGVAGFAREFWKRTNPVETIKGLVQAAGDVPGTVKHLISADPEFLTQAHQAAKEGDYLTATRKVLSYLSMGLGHELDTQADLMKQGRIAEGTGAMAGTAAAALAPEAAGKLIGGARVPGLTATNPAVREAVQFGQASGVPIDAATATNNAAVRAAQHLSDRSLGGAQIAGKAAIAQQEGLATLGEQLAAKGHPVPVTMEQAGQGVRGAVETKVGDLGTKADVAYGKLRAIEAQTPIDVDLRPVKDALEPLYRTLASGADIAPLQGAKATAVRAMARILEGPDVAGASVVDSALSDLKALQRNAAGTPGAGAANQAVDQVHRAIQQAVAKAGPDAVQALTEGRAATTAKYVAQDVLDALHAEPVRTAQGLTSAKDAAIAQLRDVAKQAPDTLPHIGRAVLDQFMEKATAEGGFAHADKLWADWQKMGPETKSLLFKDPAYIKDLDNFFLLAKQIEKNANPSGTAHAVAMLAQGSQLLNPVHFVASIAGTAGLSALLHSPAAVKVLTQGFRLPSGSAIARSAWLAQLGRVAESAGVPLSAPTGR